MTDYWLSPDYQAHLDAIRAAPDDDLLRLVLADRLEEWGHDDRAEFARVPVELTRPWSDGGTHSRCEYPCGIAGCRRPSLRRRERELWIEYARSWFDGLPGMFRYDGQPNTDRLAGTVTFVARGFVHTARGPLAAFWGFPCPKCDGTGNNSGWNPPARHDSQCFHRIDGVACDRGRFHGPTPALVELVRREPVARVEVTDREAWADTDTADPWGYGYYKFRSDDLDGGSASSLPTILFDQLTGQGGRTRRSMTAEWRFYLTPEAARSALSDALLAAAREAAGVAPV